MTKKDWIHSRGIGYLVMAIGISLGALILAYDLIMRRSFALGWMAMIGLLVALWVVVIGRRQIRYWAEK